MTNDNDYDLVDGPEDAGEITDERRAEMTNTGDTDTTMADGMPSGAAGVANAELGTSGPPAEDILTSAELAQTEVTGGAGLDPKAYDGQRLKDYLEDSADQQQ